MKMKALAVAVGTILATPAFATNGFYDLVGIATTGDVSNLNDRVDGVKAYAKRNTGLAEANQRDIKVNAKWNDRQEGVIRQNRGRLDEMDERNRRQDDRIDNAHTRIGDVEKDSKKRDKKLSGRIDTNNERISSNTKTNEDQSQAINENAQGVSSNSNAITQVEAVNSQQAASLSRLGTYTQSNRERIEDLEGHTKDLDAGVASAIAAASHHFYLGSNAGGQISLAGGTYEGESATSLAIGAPVNDKVFTNVNWSHDSRGNDAFGGGVTIQLW